MYMAFSFFLLNAQLLNIFHYNIMGKGIKNSNESRNWTKTSKLDEFVMFEYGKV